MRIHRNHFRLWFISILALLGLILGQGLMAADGATPSRPNVVLIISDDHAWTDYSFAGHLHAKTPNIDRLATTGLTYPQFWRSCCEFISGNLA